MSWYELNLEKDDNDTFLITVEAFPEITTFSDFDEGIPGALNHGKDAIEEAIASRISEGDVLPPPIQDCDGKQYCVQMTLQTRLKSGLYMFCMIKGVSRAELARRLKWHREQVDRLFRLDHNSRLDQLEAAFVAIDVHLDVPMPELTAA